MFKKFFILRLFSFADETFDGAFLKKEEKARSESKVVVKNFTTFDKIFWLPTFVSYYKIPNLFKML